MGACLNHSGFLLEIVPEFQALEDAQFLDTHMALAYKPSYWGACL